MTKFDMTKNILLTIAYDGSNFHGWQRQSGVRTVQGELEKALSHTLGTPITIDGTSRTDAGVHAFGQRASFKCDTNVPVDKLPMILNNSLAKGRTLADRLPGEIAIVNAEEKPIDFHARFNALGKKYIYKIITGSKQDIFKRNYYYQLTGALDIMKMREAASYIIGTHDFKCFETSGGTERETTVRTVYSLDIKNVSTNVRARIHNQRNVRGKGIDSIEINNAMSSEISKIHDSEITIEIIGDGFLYNMVRIITGTLVEVGLSKKPPEEIKSIIESGNRENAGHTAPPSGLYLAEVYYERLPDLEVSNE